ncbi:unnamed protein product [Ectocarpus sp. 13 AM-2016]
MTRLVGLDACPGVTSLDVSWNALTELDSACLEGCKELWIVDASHNRLESLGGLSRVMALGYLNLSSNFIPLDGLRPLARAHILELFLGSGRSSEERRRTLCALPNLWVLDDEFVTVEERRIADDNHRHNGSGEGATSDHLLPTWNQSSPTRDKTRDKDGSTAIASPSSIVITKDAGRHHPPKTQKASTCKSGFVDLEIQGHLTQDFYENVVWKIPSRAVILFTRSPACPELVAWQTSPMDQRAYDQMEPLLARAKLSHDDLHPTSMSFGGGVDGDHRRDGWGGGSIVPSRHRSPRTPCFHFDPLPADNDSGDRGGVYAAQQAASVDSLSPPDAGSWRANIRRPRSGERVQVLRDTWSVIVTVDPEAFLVTVAPFEGIPTSAYRGEARIDSRDLYYDPRGWWSHVPAIAGNATAGPSRLHRQSRGLSASGVHRGAGSLNEALEEGDEYEPSQILNGRGSGGDREVVVDSSRNYSDLLLPLAAQQQPPPALPAAAPVSGNLSPAVPTEPSTARCLTASSNAAAAPSNPSPPPSVLRSHRCPNNNVVDVFSAEGSWDPVFVVAPPRLVGLQNQTAALRMGGRRARQVAWYRIDGPEVSVAPRPTMPRCTSLTMPFRVGDTPSRKLQQSASTSSIPRLSSKHAPLRLAAVAPSHGGDSSVYARFSQSRGLSVPSISTSSCSTPAAEKVPTSADEAWLGLQREMGSLKADNRMLGCDSSRGGGGGGGGGGSGECINTSTISASSPAMSVVTKSLAENSTVGAQATTDILAKTLTRTLDSTLSAWKEGNPVRATATVFELTQVDGRSEKDAREGASSPTSAPLTHETTRSTDVWRVDNQQQEVSPPEDCSKQVRMEGGDKPDAAPFSHRPRRIPEDGDSTAASATTRRWKPNAFRPLEWFPVPGRPVFLVDPNDVKAAPAAEPVGRPVESNTSNAFDVPPGGQGAEGGGSGNCGSSESRHAVGGEDAGEQDRAGRRGGQVKEKRRTDSGKGKPGGGSPSTRSPFPTAAVLNNGLLSPATNRDKGVRPRIWTRSRRARSGQSFHSAGALRAIDGQKSNGLLADALRLKSPGSSGVMTSLSTQVRLEIDPDDGRSRGFHRREEEHRCETRQCVEASDVGSGLAVTPGVRPMVSGSTGQRSARTKAVAPHWRHDYRQPARRVPQCQRLTISGWEGAEDAAGSTSGDLGRLPTFTPSESPELESSSRNLGAVRDMSCRGAPPSGGILKSSFARRNRGGVVRVKARPASPHHSDSGLDERFSISSAATSNNNSCCGWQKSDSM